MAYRRPSSLTQHCTVKSRRGTGQMEACWPRLVKLLVTEPLVFSRPDSLREANAPYQHDLINPYTTWRGEEAASILIFLVKMRRKRKIYRVTLPRMTAGTQSHSPGNRWGDSPRWLEYPGLLQRTRLSRRGDGFPNQAAISYTFSKPRPLHLSQGVYTLLDSQTRYFLNRRTSSGGSACS